MIESEKFLELSRELEEHHSIFYTLWQLGKPVADNSIPTAGVSFDSEGQCLEFSFNPEFWDKCSDYDKSFIISHECLHVLFRHGVRCQGTNDIHRANIALDLVVNHTLVNKFGFDRTKLTDWTKLVWVDTIFKPEEEVADNLSYEQYYQLVGPQCPMDTIDCHDKWTEKDSENVINRIEDRLSNEEKTSLRETMKAHGWRFADKSYVPPKKKWETVIKKWARKYNRPDLRDVEQWNRLNRRYTCLQSDFIIPTEMEIEHEVEGKIEVWFFQDTSASCSSHMNRFFKAAKSLPKDRFDVKLHCFDTEVYETTLESGKLYGFGGTEFAPIEKYIQAYMSKNKVPYPQAVFIITDGMGNPVYPKYANRWYWFLTTSYKRCIPEASNVFELSNFE
jgi:predicted metal-dependent peptidase